MSLAALGQRIREERVRLGLDQRALAAVGGVSRNSQLAYEGGKTAPSADYLLALGDSGVDVAYVVSGKHYGSPPAVADADDADWVELAEYAMMEFTERGRASPIATARIRRDWLQASLGETQGLWIARLPAPYDALALHRGEAIICTDYRRAEKLQDGIHYLFWVNGGIILAPFARREDNAPERAVFIRNVGIEEDQYQPVARVIGVLARPI